MSLRTWLHQELIDPTNTELYALVNGRVFPKKSMKSSIEEHPYIVHKLGNNTNEGLSEGLLAERQYIQIFVHDYKDTEAGDYTQIDTVVEALKRLLVGRVVPSVGILSIIYLETSQDLDDETLDTVFKYIRLQAITGKAV